MLVVEKNSVYEIDEECLKQRSVPEECEVYQKLVQQNKAMEKIPPVSTQNQRNERYKRTGRSEKNG